MVTICCTITPEVQSATECKVDSIRFEPLYFVRDTVHALVDCESNIIVRILLHERFGKWNYIFLDILGSFVLTKIARVVVLPS